MAEQERNKITNRILLFSAAGLIVLLFILLSVLMYVFSSGSNTNEDFDIDMITSGGSDSVDISSVLIPEFIGITAEGKTAGVSFSDKVLYDISKTVAPVISYVMTEENLVRDGITDWDSLTECESSVYVRFHTQLPGAVVRLFSDVFSGNDITPTADTAYVYEMFIIPYSEKDGAITVCVRSLDGEVRTYTAEDPHVFITAGDITLMMKSYSTSLDEFVFAGDSFDSLSYTEPVFTERIAPRNVVMSNNTAQLINNSPSGVKKLIGIFGMNPDKVKLAQTEDGVSNYIDSFGVLYIREWGFEYKSTADGGMKIKDITGYLSADPIGIGEYIKATVSVFEDIREISKSFAGGEAGVFLSSVTSARGRVTVELTYSVDNIPLDDAEPAIRAVYENGVLKEAEIYAMSVRTTSDKSEIMTERGFASHLESRDILAASVNLVYRSDFSSEPIKPEWCAKVKSE